ncbi:hypothetical protein TNCT_483581 [Trichonephila clavata]|uniref:Uncharacterized protein n=1 Tax=Trichonephila clavata TaxID=2740835 RepID=A0A8X6H459_TRICU|nr:hypothetical protein TNCT_483581 [Trichonephila clavata]
MLRKPMQLRKRLIRNLEPHMKRSCLKKRKKESFSHDDISDDGWVQLVSKKGRKNRKNETQSSATFINKTLEANKSDDSSPIEESPKKSIPRISVKKNAGKESPKKKEGKESPKKDKTKVETLQNIDSSIDQNQFAPEPAEEKAAKDVKQSPNLEKSKIQNIVVEVSKSDNVEKQLLKEVAKETKVIEESSKSKKKKKKNTEVILQENEPLEKISDLATEQVISETLAPKKSAITNSVTDSSPVKNNKVEENQPSEMKTSNVAFDELAGLYPETKEQKKKKKVRREH